MFQMSLKVAAKGQTENNAGKCPSHITLPGPVRAVPGLFSTKIVRPLTGPVRHRTNFDSPHGGCVAMFPGSYVPRVLCSPAPMFPGSDVPPSYVPQYLCSPALVNPCPMFPGTYVPPSYVPRYLCSPYLCSPVPMFPRTYVPPFHH